MYAELEIKNQVDFSNVLLASWEPSFLKAVLEVTPDPDQPNKKMSQVKLAELSGVAQKTISNLIAGRGKAQFESIQKVGSTLGIHFVADFNDSINNQKVLEAIKARYK